jgi:hypothetical protein
MTVINRNSPKYAPGPVPTDPKDLPRYLSEEFNKISASIGLLADGQMEVTYKAPTRLGPGMLRLADGTSWNPGGGEGLYRRTLAGAWVLVG